jgi:hypothetical protein
LKKAVNKLLRKIKALKFATGIKNHALCRDLGLQEILIYSESRFFLDL